MSSDCSAGEGFGHKMDKGSVPLSEQPAASATATRPVNLDAMVRTASRVSGVADANVPGSVDQAGQHSSMPAMGSLRRSLIAAMVIFSNLMQVRLEEDQTVSTMLI